MTITLVAITVDRRKAKTGELLVQSSDASTRVIIRQGERIVISLTDRRSFALLPGEYWIELIHEQSHAKSSQRIVVVRGGRSVVSETAEGSP